MELALALLQGVDYYDDSRIADCFYDFYNESLDGQTREKVVFTILGGYQDSSTNIIYRCSKALTQRNRISQNGSQKFRTIESVISERKPEDTVIVFVDDMLGSGNQSVQIFEEMLGIAKEQKIGVSALTSEKVEWLKATKLMFFVLVGFEEGIDRLCENMHNYGLSIDVYPSVKTREDFKCFGPQHGILLDRKDRSDAEKMAREIGCELFSDKEHRSREQKEQMALGYRNAQKLIVFSYNTPNCTLPIFWKAGYYQGKEWIPLFPRQE